MIAVVFLALSLLIDPASAEGVSNKFNACFFNKQKIQCNFKTIKQNLTKKILAYEIAWSDGRSNTYRIVPGGQSNIVFTGFSPQNQTGSLFVQDKPRLIDEQGGLWLRACYWEITHLDHSSNWKALYNPENNNIILYDFLSSNIDCEAFEGGFGPTIESSEKAK
jgi:hypothetical protein